MPSAGILPGTRNFAELMHRAAQGQVKVTPWAGYWWPYLQDGTADADRKYEQAHGQSGATSWELAHHGASMGALQWWGHCNGWAAAAVLFTEPRAPVAVNGVTFGVADQKALLSEVAMEVDADFFGQREDDPSDFTSTKFLDVYPDQYFLVLSNYMGQGLPVVMDRYTGDQVWNQPLVAYRIAPVTPSDYLGADPSAPDVYRVQVVTELWWARDDVSGDHLTEPFAFQDSDSFESRTLSFELWLDGPLVFDSSGAIQSSGNVVLAREGNAVTGGVWRLDGMNPLDSHPDYMWVPHSVAPSTGFSNPDIDVSWLLSHLDTKKI